MHKLLLLIFIITLVACGTFPADEQRQQYNSIQSRMKKDFPDEKSPNVVFESSTMLVDIRDLSIEKFLEKYNYTSEAYFIHELNELETALNKKYRLRNINKNQ